MTDKDVRAELLPCPMCGGKARMLGYPAYVWIICYNDLCGGAVQGGQNKDDVIRRWNRRTPPQPPTESLEQPDAGVVVNSGATNNFTFKSPPTINLSDAGTAKLNIYFLDTLGISQAPPIKKKEKVTVTVTDAGTLYIDVNELINSEAAKRQIDGVRRLSEKLEADYIDIVFQKHCGVLGFVEVENSTGESIRYGKWIERDDGRWWVLRIPR